MPIYQYEPAGKGGCVACRNGFELRRPLDAPPLTHCPLCHTPLRKLISAVHSPRKLKPVSVSDAKKAGFTVLKRLGKGEYERQ